MKRLAIILMLTCFAAGNFLFAQTDSVETPPKKFKLKKNVKAANKMLKKGNIYAASDLMEVIMVNSPENVGTAYALAHSYRVARDYKKAEYWFQQVVVMNPVDFPEAYYWYALMMKMNAKYDEAKSAFGDFEAAYKGEKAELKKWAKTESEGCELALKLIDDPLPVNIRHLNDHVNSPYTDVSPLMWDDSTLIFASLPTDTVIRIDGNEVAVDYHIKLYKSTMSKQHEYEEAQVFEYFQMLGYHVANGALSPDKKRFYFTKCQETREGMLCSIYVSEQKDGVWEEPYDIGEEINLSGYNNTHPHIAPAKKGTETLYFVSNRPEGKGGRDIWYSTYNVNRKKYTEPKNMGPKINTDREEVTPFYDAATGTLYFSSDGHVNMGGFDVYKSQGSGSKWEEPVNIGYPLNSSADEMYFRVTDDGKDGYFVSNRPGIISIRSETCCDDIFSFEYLKIINVAVMGYVYDEDDPTKTPIENARVALSLESAEGILQNIQIGEDTIQGRRPYFFSVNIDKNYRVSGSAEGYLTNSTPFNTNGITKSDTLWVDIYLRKLELDKVYRLRNIYYDFDKWDLREASMKTLDTLYNLMIENPTIIVEIGSHTDTRATNQYNISLSQKRAESCVNYLIGRGIQKERLQAKGYGETRLLDDCSKYPECPEDNSTDCPCHQNNRRTEFKVTGLDAKLIYEDERYEETSEEER